MAPSQSLKVAVMREILERYGILTSVEGKINLVETETETKPPQSESIGLALSGIEARL